jgi:F-type H+-transporting ATPase subunit b
MASGHLYFALYVAKPADQRPMDQTLIALGGILLKAIPTIILVLLLHWYLKGMLFGPLSRVLKQREEATAGARQRAQEASASAEEKAAKFEQALTEARAEVYREQEVQRRQWLEDQGVQIQTAKERSAGAVRTAKDNIDQESASARGNLAATTESLADEIVSAVIGKGARA